MEKEMMEKVVSYGDVLLRKADLQLLHGPFYLNDPIIDFFFAYLSSSPPRCPPSTLLVGPAPSFLILHSPDPPSLAPTLLPLRLPQQQVVMFAINDNEDVDMAGGGTHWSLLVYDRKRNVFEHYDSMSGMNMRHARAFVSNIKPFMGPKAASALLKEPWTPQQDNGYDCGVYVMAIAKTLCQAYQGDCRVCDESVSALLRTQVTPDSVSQLRTSTRELILSLAMSSR